VTFHLLWTIGSAAVILAFQTGGFFWLAKNHFHTVNKKLDALQGDVTNLRERMGKFEGLLEEHTRREA